MAKMQALRKSIPSGRLGKPAPFYVAPLSDLAGRIAMAASAIRTLSPQQLADELAQLRAQADDGSVYSVAVALMIELYQGESHRHAPPVDHELDRELSAALSRLEKQTTAADRIRVREIGEQLHRAGGVPATIAAVDRMAAGHDERRAALRSFILLKRWEGLVGATIARK